MASYRIDDPRHPLWLAIGCTFAALALAGIVYGRLPQTASSDRAAYIDPATSPCPPGRWVLACSRWRAQGWPCETGPGGVPVLVVTDPDMRGAHGYLGYRDAIGVAPDACGDNDPAPEHEIGHLLGLPDGGPTGTVMATPSNRTGLRIPERAP